MIVALESSSLFFNKYTGIPFYIHKLFGAMNEIPDLETILAFRLKKKYSSKNDFHRKILKNNHVWHLGNNILSAKKFDVVHSLHTPFLDSKKCLKVATVHDLAVHLPEFEDYNFSSEYFKKKRFALFDEFRTKADVLITVSQATKNDFLRFFDFPEDKIHVVPLAPSFDFTNIEDNHSTILEDFNLEPHSYFISLGGVSLRKNSLNLIKAYHLSQSRKEFKLVITGKIEEQHKKEVMDYVIEHRLENSIIFTKYLENEALQKLYLNAKAFLFPTFYEGFGIPILEAMASNLPVLTSQTGAAPETAGGHAILVDPFLPNSIAEGIDKLNTIDSEHLEKAKTYALGHTWSKTAKKTTSVYEKYM